jgi:hypothetical protein
VEIAHQRWPELVIDGEMQADTAVDPVISEETYPLSRIQGDANVLVCPDLQSANIAYKLLWRLGKVEAIGPILAGVNAPVHVLQRGVEVATSSTWRRCASCAPSTWRPSTRRSARRSSLLHISTPEAPGLLRGLVLFICAATRRGCESRFRSAGSSLPLQAAAAARRLAPARPARRRQ